MASKGGANMYRNILEHQSRASGKVIDKNDKYIWLKVLGSFEMYTMIGDESVTPCLVRDFFWESWITTWVINNLDSGMTFVDVGANTGYYSFLAQALGANVICFEPNPVYAKMIESTADRAGKARNIEIFKFALSNRRGSFPLHIPVGLHGSASLNKIPDGYEFIDVSVSVDKMDNLITPPRYSEVMMKIDAEGEEEKILIGAKKFLEAANKPVILMEYTPHAYSKDFLYDIRQEWDISWINYDGHDEPVSREWIESQTDWLMLVLRRKSDNMV